MKTELLPCIDLNEAVTLGSKSYIEKKLSKKLTQNKKEYSRLIKTLYKKF